MPTIGDLTSRNFDFAASALGASAVAALGSTDACGCTAGGSSAGIAIGAATCTAPRCCGVFEILIFIPLSDEISIESTLDSSSISTSFFT